MGSLPIFHRGKVRSGPADVAYDAVGEPRQNRGAAQRIDRAAREGQDREGLDCRACHNGPIVLREIESLGEPRERMVVVADALGGILHEAGVKDVRVLALDQAVAAQLVAKAVLGVGKSQTQGPWACTGE